ncbi:MAG: O-antigen ligase family protein [Pyrinomonadaceae bacterium]|nr:O-antigen ligase family protein [Pyrinomonadaceae bacterium]MCX7640234.1 O-antigen ligase family protein [Pyrinomonadaceae bacterium]MDW8305142.1 O-antigen ligase family protein [Acidobacteriota bacterium]
MKSHLSSSVFLLLLFILIFAPIAYGAVDTWAFATIALILLAVYLIWISDVIRSGQLKFSNNPLQLPILGLIVIGIIQLLPFRSVSVDSLSIVSSISLDPYATRFAVIQLFLYALFFSSALVFISDESRVRKTAIFAIVLGSLFAFLGILQQLTDPNTIFGFRIVKDAIPFGTFVNRHHFAAFMVMLAGLSFGIAYSKSLKSDRLILIWIAIIMMILAILMTGSRGAFLSLIATISLVLFLSERLSDFRGRLLVAVFVLFSSIVLLVILLGADEWLARSIGLNIQQDISSGRFHFWAVAWRIFLDHPILGTGLDSFAVVFPKYDTWNGTFRVERAHNDYLQMLSDAGLLGFVCVIAFIYLLFSQAKRSIDGQKNDFLKGIKIGALAGCFGILVHSFFDFPLRTNSNAFYFLLLSCFASEPFQAEQSSNKEISGGH